MNPLFNPLNSMLFVDLQGNLLSNLKLSFYEQVEEQGFFAKMFSDGGESNTREPLVRAYSIVRDIYNDVATPYRW